MRQISYIFFSLLLACGHVERVDNAQIRSEIKHRQIKQIPSAKFNQIAKTWGEGISKSFLEELDKGSYLNIESFKQNKRVDSLTKHYDLNWTINTKQSIVKNEKIFQLHDAYLYNSEQKLPPSDNVQQIEGDTLVYTFQLPYQHRFTQKIAAEDPNKMAYFLIKFNKKAISRLITPKELKKF